MPGLRLGLRLGFGPHARVKVRVRVKVRLWPSCQVIWLGLRLLCDMRRLECRP